MTQALILVNGFAASDDALPANALVTLANDNTGGETTYLWSITAQPPGPPDALTSTTTLATTMTPTKEGNYRIQVIVNQGLGTERVASAIVGVLQVRSMISQPAAGETTELGPQGWAVRMNQTIRLVDQLNTDPGCFICVTSTGEPEGTPVVFSGVQTILATLPGEKTIPAVSVVDAASASDVVGAVGVVIAAVDGGSIGPGSLVYVRMNGLASVPIAGSPAAGTALAAAGSPAASIVPVASLLPTDPYRYVGVSCGIDPVLAGNTLVAWAGAGTQPMNGGGVTWNGIDDTQFSASQTLPNPIAALTFGASVVNPQLNVVAAPQMSKSGFTINLSANEITNGVASWLFDPTFDLASMGDYSWSFRAPIPGPSPTSGESVSVGILYAGDASGLMIADMIEFADDTFGAIVTKRRVVQVNRIDTVTMVLSEDTFSNAAYVWLASGHTDLTHNDTAYAGGTGVPVGTASVQASGWIPGPVTGSTPNGVGLFISSFFYAPGPAWATSGCNRVGVILGGAWTNAISGAQTMTISGVRFEP